MVGVNQSTSKFSIIDLWGAAFMPSRLFKTNSDSALSSDCGYQAPVVLLCVEREILPKGRSHICKLSSKLRHRGVA